MSSVKTNTGLIILLSCLCFAHPDHVISSSMEWVQIGKPLTPRSGSSICYNPETGTVLLFGGHSGSHLSDTWEWDGTRWNFRLREHIPDVFWGEPALLFDSMHNRILLLGSRYPDSLFQIWEWTYSDWSLIDESDFLPSKWTYYSLAYDSNRDVICVFGGTSEDALDDLWEWDQDEWHQIPKSNPWPPAMFISGMIYNPDIEKVVVLLDFNGKLELWYWDGSQWENPEVSPPRPPVRIVQRIVYDPDRSVIVLFSGNGNYDDTWEFDGVQWHEMNPPHKPSGRSGFAATWDAGSRQLMLFGGSHTPELFGDTWFYDGVDWTYVTPDPYYPPDLGGHNMEYDPSSQTTVLYGGVESSCMSTDTYLWDGQTWSCYNLSPNPGQVSRHCMAYFADHDGIVLYGGRKWDGPAYFNDKMWVFRDQTWNELTPPVVPGPRSSATMVYDSIRGRLMLFGGVSADYNDPPYQEWEDETWEYDGSTWYQVFPDHHPPGLWGFGMAFDSCRGVAVLFGGCAENGYYDKTWEYDGVDWTRIEPATTNPARRKELRLTFDQRRCRVVMHGGVQNLEPGFDETWEWDGYDWYLIEPKGGRAAPYYGHAMVYDSAQKCTTIFGGGHGEVTVETFVYRHSNPDICDQMGVTLDLSQSVFHAGDIFTCTAHFCNNTGDVLTGFPLLVLLDVFGSYFWGPTFTQEFDSYLAQYPSFPEDVTDVEVLPSFSWPSNVGAAQGIRFYAALVDPAVHILIGQFGSAEFGWE